MTRAIPLSKTVSVYLPFRLTKRGGRKEMLIPPDAPPRERIDNTLVKALARAFRWNRLLESGQFATLAELAIREGISPSYITRVLRLTLLAPPIVDKILDGKQGVDTNLGNLLEPFPLSWKAQLEQFG